MVKIVRCRRPQRARINLAINQQEYSVSISFLIFDFYLVKKKTKKKRKLKLEPSSVYIISN